MNKVTPQDSPANAYVELGVVRLRSVESIANSKINGDLEQIVLENDETVVKRGRIADDVLPVVQHALCGDGTSWDIEVYRERTSVQTTALR